MSKLKYQNVPATFKAYAFINNWTDEECDDISKLYYEKMAKLLNEFDVIEPDEYDQYGITPDTDFHELMDIHIKKNRVSKRVADKLEKLLDKKIYQLGAEYGFLGDLIYDVFYERVQWYF